MHAAFRAITGFVVSFIALAVHGAIINITRYAPGRGMVMMFMVIMIMGMIVFMFFYSTSYRDEFHVAYRAIPLFVVFFFAFAFHGTEVRQCLSFA
jgi:hypothetical protein